MLAAAVSSWVVVEPVSNLYSRPAEGTDVVTQAAYATEVEILERNGIWRRVRTPDDYTGWILAESLRERPEGPYAKAGRTARTDSLFANLYDVPNVTARPPLITLPYDVRLEVVSEPEDEESRWVEVALPDDRIAWVQRGDLDFSDDPLEVEEVIALAKRFAGLPYLWGGTTTFGFDCSGFTQMLYRRRGIAIPRDSGPQSGWEGGRPVERDRLQPGDLLFFGDEPNRVSHTGMYIGDGEFVHATAHDRPAVQVSSLDEPYWSGLLLSARRPR